MKISTIARGIALFAAFSAIVIALGGCYSSNKPADGSKSDTKRTGKTKAAARADSSKSLTDELVQAGQRQRELGPPLVDDPGRLQRLAPDQPVWFDRTSKQVVLHGEVCQAGYPLEFFATYSNRSYEAVMSVNVTPSIVHAGLLLSGAVPGHPAQFRPKSPASSEPEIIPATGTEVAIEVRWKDKNGKLQSAPAQHWIRNIKTKKELDSNWVFAGSMFVTDETTGKKYYQADSGELICVLSLPGAMLDLPICGYGAIEARSFEAFQERLPPPGTPATILLKPILSATVGHGVGFPPAETSTALTGDLRAGLEQKAVEAAKRWLVLIDQGQYTRSWETTAEHFKNSVERRDFIKRLNETRKPLGDVKSRELQSQRYTMSLPGAPNGQYVVLQYKTSFAGGKSIVETITPMLDKDKKWRVSGYYLK